MAHLQIECSVFDPVRTTTVTTAPSFIIDTWFSYALITQDLFTRLPGIPTLGTGRVDLSSGMSMTRPRVEIGLQIRNVRAMPVQAFVVDNGPADLLLGSDFLRLLFELGNPFEPGKPAASLEPPPKRAANSLALRLISPDEQPPLVDVERFLSAVRRIHNVAVVAETGIHQHQDWPLRDRERAKQNAIRQTIRRDSNLSDDQKLRLTWVESGSIWVTLKSGAASGLKWISQLFRLSMDARLQQTMAEAAAADERAQIAKMTRDEIVRARRAEENLRYAKSVAEARDEWRKQILAELDFREALSKRIHDPEARESVQRELDRAVTDLAESKIFGLVEHVPELPDDDEPLPRLSGVDDSNRR